MRLELSNDPVLLELKITEKGKPDVIATVDIFEAADLLNAESMKTKAAQATEGSRPYFIAVRDNVLRGHYKIDGASYTLANTFARFVTEACAAEEKKTTALVELLVGTESTPPCGLPTNGESGSPTATESKPSSKSSEATSQTIGPE